MLGLDAFRGPAPDLGQQHLDEVLGQAERLADVAQCAARAVADDGRAQRGMVAVVHPLHDDLAPLVLEVAFRLYPAFAAAGPVGRVAALGDDTLELQLAGMLEERAAA